jgi:hypothetical protein
VLFHLNTANNLEIYEMDDFSKEKLEEICDLKQPILFDFDEEEIMEKTNKNFILNNYPAFDVNIRTSTSSNSTTINEKQDETYLPITLQLANNLFTQDSSGCYFTENNNTFLQETGVYKNMQYNDKFLRPYMVSNCYYDILFGSANSTTPFRYELNYRNYFLVTQGSVDIKLTPPDSSKYLHTCYDYDNFEFYSMINPWNIQPKYSSDFDKVKCLDIHVDVGKIVFIPAYWWHSIKFSKNACVSSFKYRTYMNNTAISNHIFMHFLQLQNVKRDFVKKNIADHIVSSDNVESHSTDLEGHRQVDTNTNSNIADQHNNNKNKNKKKIKINNLAFLD